MGNGPRWHSWLVVAVIGSTLLTLALAAAIRLDSLPVGLQAHYFADASSTPPALASTIERPSTAGVVAAWHGSPPETFSTQWTGWVFALRGGTYTIATASDAGSWVVVDGWSVVDNARHETRLTTGSVHLTRGAHAVRIRYVQHGEPVQFEFLWAREGAPLEPVPAWALRPVRISVGRWIARILLDLFLPASEWLWVGILLAGGVTIGWLGAVHLRRWLERHCDFRVLRWILAGALVLCLTGVWYGLPGSWVSIEFTPAALEAAWSARFSHGWFDTYPPVQYYILTAAISPALLLQALGRVNLSGSATASTLLFVVCRLVSVAAALGAVMATCVAGTYAFGRRAGVGAAAVLALVAPFIYYAKTANVEVPYVFWFAVSMAFYVRLLERLQLKDFILFAASATLAVCTKDQAYGLYLAAPVVIVAEMWRANRRAGLAHPLRRALVDRRLAASAITAALVFTVCDNLVFNPTGFLSHVRYITGNGSRYEMFEPTVAGRIDLLRLTVHLIEESFGWPLFVTTLAGLAIAATTPRLRRVAAWLALTLVTYYVGFINVIRYDYDRFVVPVCVVLALFGGLAIDTWLQSGRGRAWRVVGLAGVFAYTLLYAATVDVLMLGDSRYAAERWMQTHAGYTTLVGFTGMQAILPTLDDFPRADIGSVADLERARPVYYVLNADYARAVPPDTSWGQVIAGLRDHSLGYRLVYRFRRNSPWPWLPGGHPDLVGPRDDLPVSSALRFINPTIEIFQRETTSGSPGKD